jgi:hypothetical protein
MVSILYFCWFLCYIYLIICIWLIISLFLWIWIHGFSSWWLSHPKSKYQDSNEYIWGSYRLSLYSCWNQTSLQDGGHKVPCNQRSHAKESGLKIDTGAMYDSFPWAFRPPWGKILDLVPNVVFCLRRKNYWIEWYS